MSGQQNDLKYTSAVALDEVSVAPSAFFGSLLIFFISIPFVVFGSGFVVMIGAVIIVLSLVDAANIATLMLTTSCLVDNGTLVIKYGMARRLNISIPATAIRDVKIKQTRYIAQNRLSAGQVSSSHEVKPKAIVFRLTPST